MLSFIMLIITFLTALTGLLFKTTKDEPDKRLLSRLKPGGWVLLTLAISALIVGITDKYYTVRDQKKDKILEAQEKRLDSNAKVIERLKMNSILASARNQNEKLQQQKEYLETFSKRTDEYNQFLIAQNERLLHPIEKFSVSVIISLDANQSMVRSFKERLLNAKNHPASGIIVCNNETLYPDCDKENEKRFCQFLYNIYMELHFFKSKKAKTGIGDFALRTAVRLSKRDLQVYDSLLQLRIIDPPKSFLKYDVVKDEFIIDSKALEVEWQQNNLLYAGLSDFKKNMVITRLTGYDSQIIFRVNKIQLNTRQGLHLSISNFAKIGDRPLVYKNILTDEQIFK